jgi:hypothetical protein
MEILRMTGQGYPAGETADRLDPGTRTIDTFHENFPAWLKRMYFNEMVDVAGRRPERELLESRNPR